MLRVRPCSPPAPRPLAHGLIQWPEQSPAACPLLLYHHQQPSLDEIAQVLGTKYVRCFARRDGLVSAYCSADTSTLTTVNNEEAVEIAKAYGIPVPDEALPLRGAVLFWGASVGKLANL